MSERFTEPQMITLAARAIGKIDARGSRGIERVTNEEIAAMAATLACLGIPVIPPGSDELPAILATEPQGERE